MRRWQSFAVLSVVSFACGTTPLEAGDAATTGTGGGGASGGDAARPAVTPVASDAGSGPDVGDAGPADAAGEVGPIAATWSAIYQGMLVNPSYPSNCMGASCHDPGTQKGIDLSTREKGYSTISHRLVAGSPDTSQLVSVIQSGKMPLGKARMSQSDVDLIRAWIQAGALDD